MMTFRDWSRLNLGLLGVLALAVLWTLMAGLRAARLDALPEPAPQSYEPVVYPHSNAASLPQTPMVLAAVRSNPMRPDRRRAEGRYGQVVIDRPAETEPPAPVPGFRVEGIVRPGRGPALAAIGWDRSPARLVQLGDDLQGFVLDGVRADSVFLARPDTAIGLPVPGPRYLEAE